MKTINWNDGLGPRSRAAWLLLIRGDEITPFKGVNVPQVVVVLGRDYQKAGKWSNTIFRLGLADGVREIAGRDGWETGRFAEGLGKAVGRPTPDTWQELADALGVPVPSAQKFLRAWRPKDAAGLDEVEAAINDLAAPA